MDAQYFLVRDDINILKYMNDNLIECVEWQEDELITHPTVKMGGELGILWPNWSNEITLPNNISIDEIRNTINKGINKYNEDSSKN